MGVQRRLRDGWAAGGVTAGAYANMCSPMVVCVHLPRFELAVAAGGGAAAERGTFADGPLAIAPARAQVRAGARPGRCIGEVSAAAETFGVASGMALAEALVRCPELTLVPADPLGVAEAWETILRALEAIGAAVQAPLPGLAFFEADGLRRMHGGLRQVLAAARGACAVGVTAGRVRVRVGAGPTRFCALAAASAARPGRGAVVVEGGPAGIRRWLAVRPIELLRFREETAVLVAPLRKLGLRRLGEVEALGADAMADRFGAPGVCAHGLACGRDTPLLPRIPPELLRETMALHEADVGPALERVLLVLVERLLARRERGGRALRSATLSARLVEGGTWRETVVFRAAIADSRRIVLALGPRLSHLPAPAEALCLEVERFGPPLAEQGELPRLRHATGVDARLRSGRLAEAVDQARAAAGPDAALRVVCVEPDSRVPERRAALVPFQGVR